MSIRDDWNKVMKARQALEDAPTLPDRFYASCCYSDECRAFCESHKFVIGLFIDKAELPLDRAA